MEQDGHEADDIIASYAHYATTNSVNGTPPENHKVIIVSGDKDMFQLVKNNVTVLDPTNSKSYGNIFVCFAIIIL